MCLVALLLCGAGPAVAKAAAATWTQVRYYDERYDGRATANGEIFDHRELTFASKSLPFGTVVTVHYNGKAVTVRCNDRGPNFIELTKGAFQKLAETELGVLNATYEIHDKR